LWMSAESPAPERQVAQYLRVLEERAKERRLAESASGVGGPQEEKKALRVVLGEREIELPPGVVHLKSKNGGDVFLIGSAHVSQASVDDVSQVGFSTWLR